MGIASLSCSILTPALLTALQHSTTLYSMQGYRGLALMLVVLLVVASVIPEAEAKWKRGNGLGAGAPPPSPADAGPGDLAGAPSPAEENRRDSKRNYRQYMGGQ